MYKISRGYTNGQLTKAQRTSSLFASEPIVLGKVLRRGAAALWVTEEAFNRNKLQLDRLLKAGAIKIEKIGQVESPAIEETPTPEPAVEVSAAESDLVVEEPIVEEELAEEELDETESI